MEQRNQQTQTQQTVQGLLPQQVLEVRLLELPTLGFEERVKAELLDNPALEEVPAEPFETSLQEEERSGESRADDYLTADDIPDFIEPQTSRRGAAEIPFAESESFYETLQSQIGERKLNERAALVVTYLIGSLDDGGILRKPLSQISDELCFSEGLDIPEEELEAGVATLQTFDPPGIGAQSLQECLLIQLRRREQNRYTLLAEQLLESSFDDFIRKGHERMKRRMNLDDATYDHVWELLTPLNPRPGSPLSEVIGHSTQQVTPDFIVEPTDDGGILLNLNNSNIPELRISPDYQQMLDAYLQKGDRSKSAREAMLFVRQKTEAAKGFMDAVRVRNQTMLRVMKAIIALQRPFFLEGDERLLRPMILKDVADVTGYDISTISRVSNSKYVQTNYDIYPLRHFFSDGVTTNEGEELSVREIIRTLRELIGEEDKSAPLPDEKLCDLLQQKGFNIARRTVAKYREQLGLPVARLRRER